METMEFIIENKFKGAYPEPIPAHLALPQWVKDQPNREEGIHLNNKGTAFSPTYKRCVPFMDIMRTGYILPLWVDLGFSYDECTPEECGDENCPRTSIHVDWKESIGEGRLQSKFGKVVESRAWSSWGNIPELETSVPNSSMTFINPWTIKTPPGYSTLITAPFNDDSRPHPAIKTLTGLVNTDTYFNPITFFFHVKYGFNGTLKKLSLIHISEPTRPY